MICPHCHHAFHDQVEELRIGFDREFGWTLHKRTCAACRRLVLMLAWGPPIKSPHGAFQGINGTPETRLVHPKGSTRKACPQQVPRDIAADHLEACLVLPDSPKASAALSRRCLQHLLRSAAGVKHGDLAREIQEVLDSQKLPSYLAEAIDAVRNIGNFAAHPQKSQHTGTILDVEPGEAEWNLDVLDQLFDFYYVQPSVVAQKKAALNKKLQEAGKPPMK